jgi:hypothetical protein
LSGIDIVADQESRYFSKPELKLKKQRNRQMRLYLKEFPVKELDRSSTLNKQKFSRIKMESGEKPLTFYNRLQSQKREMK